MPLRAVTFDFHNTLANCDAWFELEVRSLVPRVLEWHAAREGLPLDSAVSDRAVAIYRALRLEIIQHGEERDALDCALHVLQELDYPMPADTVAEGVESVMRETLADSTPVPGAVDAVRHLGDEGYRLGVVSSAVYHPFLEWSLDKFGILDAFDVVVTSASAGWYKSRPEIYEHTLARLGVPAGEAVHVGDSYRFDVESARRLGMRTVWYAVNRREGDGDDADLTVDSLHGIGPALVERFGD